MFCFVSPIFSYNKAALEYLKIHKKARSTNLEDLDFSYANLVGIDLSNAKLCRANFMGADLSRANFSGADLTEATGGIMAEANLFKANLTRFKGNGSIFINAILTEANLTSAVFNQCNFSNAKLDNAVLYKTEFNHTNLIGAIFQRSDLSCVKFYCSDIRESNFFEANLTQVDFHAVYKHGTQGYKIGKGIHYPDKHMTVDDWKAINFKGADLAGAYMQGCCLSKLDLQQQGALNLDKITGCLAC